jgi:Tol biopolymer transport system component
VGPTGGPANGPSSYARISADGSTVAFSSRASNLVIGDTNQALDVFVVDVRTLAIERVSVDSAGLQADSDCAIDAISADGGVVAFESHADDLVPGDTNGCSDVFVRDRGTGTTERVSVAAGGGQGDLDSSDATLSADGSLVAFFSRADNLVAGDRNGASDVFVHERATGRTERVSVNSSGGPGNADSDGASISADGRIVAFRSFADDLVPGDTNGDYDVFANERCRTDASWSNFGAGVAGTFGVPAFTARSNPVLGTPIALDLGNSSASTTVDVLVVGLGRTSTETASGGHLLVQPLFTQTQLLAPAGATFRGNVPRDAAFCGVTIDLQAIEVDPGAPQGLSFTRGLELTLGR